MVRFFFFILGFGLTLIGLIFIISYMNLLTIGYNLSEYVYFISRRIECLIAVLGAIILTITIYIGGKDELYI